MLDKFPGRETLSGFGVLDAVRVKRCTILAKPQACRRSTRKMEKGCGAANNNQQYQHRELTLGSHSTFSLRHARRFVFMLCMLCMLCAPG